MKNQKWINVNQIVKKDYEEYNCGCNYSNILKYNKCEEMTNECNYNETKCNNKCISM